MNPADALELLVTGNARERLEAATYLARHARQEDRPRLREALGKEEITWTKRRLALAVARLDKEAPQPQHEGVDTTPPELAEEVYAQAIEETTGRLVHELRPILGAIEFYAETEVPKFEKSDLRRELARMEAMLDAIDELSRAASAPRLQEFDLSQLVQDLAVHESRRLDGRVTLAGPEPLVVTGDPTLVEIGLRNGLSNAIEASREVSEPITVTWGETDRDYWVAVFDRGVGLPGARSQIFDIGTTTKPGHLGMGLALAHRAANSLNGAITLTEPDSGGTRYEFRWPKLEGQDEGSAA